MWRTSVRIGRFWHRFAEGVRPNRRRWESIRAPFGETQFSDFGSRYTSFFSQIYGDASSCPRDFIFALRVRWEQFSLRPLSSAKFPRNHRRLRLLLLPLSMPLIWLPKDAARKPSRC